MAASPSLSLSARPSSFAHAHCLVDVTLYKEEEEEEEGIRFLSLFLSLARSLALSPPRLHSNAPYSTPTEDRSTGRCRGRGQVDDTAGFMQAGS